MRVLRGLAAMLAIATLCFVAVGSAQSGAVPIRCDQGNEGLGLTPTGAVTLDGLSLQRSTVTGRYQADGGIDFDVNAGQLVAVEPPASVCLNTASTITLTVSNPFNGATSAIGLVSP